jgi:hypothetical protein
MPAESSYPHPLASSPSPVPLWPTYEVDGIQSQIRSISKLPSNRTVLEDRVHSLGVSSYSSSFEVLDVLAQAHSLSYEAKLLLDGVPWRDAGGGGIGAEKVPAVEAGKVLKGAEDFVTANCWEREWLAIATASE